VKTPHCVIHVFVCRCCNRFYLVILIFIIAIGAISKFIDQIGGLLAYPIRKNLSILAQLGKS